ncbi:hypothetical protein QYF36_024774 [Acer negundo]|nr:hypothetical protein QYF36_024774 [Acer negundo]
MDISNVCPVCKTLLSTTSSRLLVEDSRGAALDPSNLRLFLVNSDAAIDVSRGVVGIGLVIRNSEGCVMASSSQQLFASFSPMVAEAVAIQKGNQLAIDTGLVPLEMVSDAAVVVGLVNDMEDHASEIGLVIDAIRKGPFYC